MPRRASKKTSAAGAPGSCGVAPVQVIERLPPAQDDTAGPPAGEMRDNQAYQAWLSPPGQAFGQA
jgi:hypothetical protein